MTCMPVKAKYLLVSLILNGTLVTTKYRIVN